VSLLVGKVVGAASTIKCGFASPLETGTTQVGGVDDDYPSTFAGVSCTDSPQPQAPVWFGLLKMNCADILSAL